MGLWLETSDAPCVYCGHGAPATGAGTAAPPPAAASTSSTRPTSGGMAEDEAAVVAKENGWDAVSTVKLTCDEPSHTPKGKLYTDGKGTFFGADNTGHVGWGFKVWTVKKGNKLHYAGNSVWDGSKWVYRDRGTR